MHGHNIHNLWVKRKQRWWEGNTQQIRGNQSLRSFMGDDALPYGGVDKRSTLFKNEKLPESYHCLVTQEMRGNQPLFLKP
jgi:hypothetical protein